MLLFLDSINPLEKNHKNNSMKMIPGTSAGPVSVAFFPYSYSNSKERKNANCKQFSKSLGLFWQGKIYTDHTHISH